MSDAPPDARPARVIDARGLRCPLPVIRLEAALRALPDGAVVTIRTDDPIAKLDVPHAARGGGHACVLVEEAAGSCVFAVTRGGEDAHA